MQMPSGPLTRPGSSRIPLAPASMASGKGCAFPEARLTLDALPAELLEIIARKLAPADYSQFSLTNRRLRQVLADPFNRRAMVDAAVLKAGTHRREVLAASRLHAANAAIQAMDFLAGAWTLLAQQQVQPGAGVRLWEKSRAGPLHFGLAQPARQT
jgi:hypothetical protein